MLNRIVLISALAVLAATVTGRCPAADEGQTFIYGSQLMTPQERMDYRAKLRAAETAEERDRIRREHHEQMKERAKAQGITLPDEPPPRGGGMGPGGGMGLGPGMGAPHGMRRSGNGIYGSRLMTPQERTEYRAKLRAAKTAEERGRIRREHHEQIKERAKAQGITLPDEPPPRDGGMGPGGGMNR